MRASTGLGYFNRRSWRQQYRTGTISMVRTSMAMPPTLGRAMGIMMSLPRPWLVITGTNGAEEYCQSFPGLV